MDNTLIGATNNYGFRGNIASGTNRYNVYMDGTAQNYFAGYVGIGIATPTHKFHVVNTDGAISNIFSTGSIVPIAGSIQNDFDATITPASDISNYATGAFILRNAGTQSITSTAQGAMALGIYAFNNATAGTLTNFTGINLINTNTSTGIITNMHGTLTRTATNTGTVTNYYAHRVLSQTVGSSICAAYASEISSAFNRYALYLIGTAKSYFGGVIGLGQGAPTALLHIKAGTATASTAPLKLTSGALLTVAEAGAIEFLTNAYYATITTGAARKTFAFLESPLFTGTPTLPTGTIAVTQAANTNNTTVATTEYVDRTQIFSASLSLTSAQILALNTTPITIVSAPGASKYIEVISATGEYTFVTAAYSTNTYLTIIYTGASEVVASNAAILTGTVNLIYQFSVAPATSPQTTATQILTNTALQVKVPVGNPLLGSGTVKVKVLYRIVTL